MPYERAKVLAAGRELGPAAGDPRGPDRDEGTVTGPSSQKSLPYQAFVDLADTLVADFDVVHLLHELARHCITLLDVTAAAVILADEHEALKVLASSSEQARLVALHQLQITQQGPSLEAYQTGVPVAAADLSQHAHRWPDFVAEAQAQGFHAVHALPMRLRDDVIGALTLYGNTALQDLDLVLAQALADVATVGILQQRTRSRSETLVHQLQHALGSRVVIEQAKGLLADRADITVGEAFVRLRDYARSHNKRLHELAHQIVDDRAHADLVLRHGVDLSAPSE